MSPRRHVSLKKKAEKWNDPLRGIEEIAKKRFGALPSTIFERLIIPFVEENEEHILCKLFLEMMENSGNDYEDLEYYLYEKHGDLMLFEYENDEIPPLWQKIIYKFICDEYPDELPID
jgi:hypothetical protein